MEGVERTTYQDQYRCPRCPTFSIEKGPKLLEHIGTHILHDPSFESAGEVCGLCLSVGGVCAIRLAHRKGGVDVVNMTDSRCPNLYKLSLKAAGTSAKTSPCSNVPLSSMPGFIRCCPNQGKPPEVISL